MIANETGTKWQMTMSVSLQNDSYSTFRNGNIAARLKKLGLTRKSNGEYVGPASSHDLGEFFTIFLAELNEPNTRKCTARGRRARLNRLLLELKSVRN